MPRKAAKDALQDYLKADYNRWRLLARNREFREDVGKYLTQYEKLESWVKRHDPLWSSKTLDKYYTLEYRYLGRWRVNRLPSLVLWPDSERVITCEGLERWYQAARKAKPDFSISAPPVSILGSRPGGRFQYVIEISVDRSLTLDQLIPLIHKELRHSYFGGHDRGKPQSLDFQLKVFDLMKKQINGKEPTVANVARILRRRQSTVREAYLSVGRKITTLDIQSEFRDSIARPILKNPKLRHPLALEKLPACTNNIPDVGPISACTDPKCRTALTDADFCSAHRAYFLQDEVSQSARLVHNWSALEHGLIRKKIRQEALQANFLRRLITPLLFVFSIGREWFPEART